MLNWLFRKRPADAVPATQDPREAAAAPAASAPAPTSLPDWTARLSAARGNDAALLELALAAPLLQQRSEAVEAIEGEAGLRLAEREFRKRDRKLHSRLKQRLDAAVKQREARIAAGSLLAGAQDWLTQAIVPVNQLLALDKAWAALPPSALEPAQLEAYAALRQGLDTLLRERGEAQQQVERWTAAVQPLLQAAPGELQALADRGAAEDVSALATRLESWHSRRPAQAEGLPIDLALGELLRSARLVEAGLREAARAVPEPAAAPDPVPEPLAAAEPTERAPARSRPSPEHRQQIEQALAEAEAAAGDGRLAALQPPLQAIDQWLADPALAVPADLRERHQALRAEHRRLLDWQRWGGARARDELLAQAERLAQASTPPSDEPASSEDPAPADAPRRSRPPALNLKQHAAQIQALRQQWRQLDQQAAPAGQALWQRFDQALQAAYQPVAAQQAQLKAARQQNLAQREALLAELEASTPAPGQGEAEASAWRQAGQALAHFQAAWRKLGPLEHTVPAAARDALQQRLNTSLAQIEGPLHQARSEAVTRREQLIARADALQQEAGAGRAASDPLRRLRDLQADWTEEARRAVLPRQLEASLWTRFKAAADGVQAAREQVQASRDAELAAARDAERSKKVAWALQCQALSSALARCEAEEDGGNPEAQASDGDPGAAVPALPQAWARALAGRQAGAGSADADLLRLEIALDLPTPEAHQAERQQLKLQALKQTLEGRSAPGSRPAGDTLLAVLGQRGLAPVQRSRLQAIVAALSALPPGSFAR
jgi:exonuclease SbcC